MIPEWATNSVYISDLLGKKYPKVHAGLDAILKEAGIPLRTITKTNDVWVADCMPIQMEEGRYLQFTYAPDYLKGFESLITPPETCRLKFMTHYQRSNLILDGGNVVAAEKRVILTEKVYRENRDRERSEIRALLENLLQVDVIMIPTEPFDRIGHSDGVVRFLSEDAVVMNHYSGKNSDYGKKLRNILEKRGLAVEHLPYTPARQATRNDVGSAVGNFVNYFRLGNLVILPSYDTPKDEVALLRMQSLLPQARILTLPSRSLAQDGGVLRCVTYTIKEFSRNTSTFAKPK